MAEIAPREVVPRMRVRVLSQGRKSGPWGIVAGAEGLLSQGRKKYCLTGGRIIVAGAEGSRGKNPFQDSIPGLGEYLSVIKYLSNVFNANALQNIWNGGATPSS